MNSLVRTLGIVGLLALTPLAPLWAQTRGVGPWHPVKDEIDFFSDRAKDRANAQIAELKKTYNKDLVIEALKAPKRPANLDVKDKKAVDKFFDQFADQRFNSQHVNGVYVMIIDEPHVLRVEVGNNTRVEGYFTIDNRDRLIEKLKEKLSERNGKDSHDAALLAATNYVVDSIKTNHPVVNRKGAVAPAAAPVNHADPEAASASRTNWMPIVMIIGVILVVWIVFALIRGLFAGGGGGAPGMGYGGGGGFMSTFLGGLFGAAAGMWMYNSFFGGHSSSAWAAGPNDSGSSYPDSGPADTSGSVGGADYGADDAGKGDWGGGDAGGGGDWGGGGGDWGGGGGDWGGGGGDWGGGGGGDW